MNKENPVVPEELLGAWKIVWASPLGRIYIITFFFLLGFLSVNLFKMVNDNPIEQISEEVIKEATGLDIDITPEGKE